MMNGGGESALLLLRLGQLQVEDKSGKSKAAAVSI